MGVVEHAHRVAEARRGVDVHHPELSARLRVAVGHADRHRLLQGQDVADARLAHESVHQRQLGGARVAEHGVDAFLLQDLEKRLLAGEKGHGEASWRGMIAPLP